MAAAHEERFTRKKHDQSFPVNAVRYVLNEASIADLSKLQAIAFYDKPFLKFERLLETYHAFAPKGLKSFVTAIPVWIKEKLFMRGVIWDELAKIAPGKTTMLFPEHHLSHAASAFYPSPFAKAAIITIDGVGEWATTTIGHGEGKSIRVLRQMDFPHSLGLLYTAVTYYCGFKVNSGEYKLMGLAPYGHGNEEETSLCKQRMLNHLVDTREDGSILLNMEYFDYAAGLCMCNEKKWLDLFGFPKREPETGLTREYMNMALAVQEITEEIVLRLGRTAKALTGAKNLVMSGGVALNCVANGKLLKAAVFDDIWIQPAAGDAGGSIGAAYAAWHVWKGMERKEPNGSDAMRGAYLGPEFSNVDVRRTARGHNAPFREFADFDCLCEEVAGLLAGGHVVGWFQGRMEFGPRALGNRSILGDPRNPEMQKKLNLKIKYREGFRPFAPSVLEENISDYFELDRPSPYMLLVAPVCRERRCAVPGNYGRMDMWEKLYYLRSDIPAVTHVDFSARIQSVSAATNRKYWKLIEAFEKKTGYGVIVNTSFNIRGEPIVCTPEQAYRCFMATEMDYLVMENFLFSKADQPTWNEECVRQDRFGLD